MVQIYNFEVILVGAKKYKVYARNSWCFVKEWSLNSESDTLNEIDYGLAPLEKTRWNEGKGGYKINLYMSKGIPVLASPIE